MEHCQKGMGYSWVLPLPLWAQLWGTAVEMGLCWFHLRAGAANASEGLVECK